MRPAYGKLHIFRCGRARDVQGFGVVRHSTPDLRYLPVCSGSFNAPRGVCASISTCEATMLFVLLSHKIISVVNTTEVT